MSLCRILDKLYVPLYDLIELDDGRMLLGRFW